MFFYENIYIIAIKNKYIRRDYSLDDVESGSVADLHRELSGPALPAVPGPPPPSAGLTSRVVAAASLSAVASASGIPSASMVASAPVGSPRAVAVGVAKV